MQYPATVTLTHYDHNDEPKQSEITFGQYAEDDFPCVEARNEEDAKDEVREVLLRQDNLGDCEVDKIEIHEAL